MIIECSKITKSYSSAQGDIRVLDNISFTVEPSEFVCIVGPSGCGKSTLLRIIADLIPTTSGEVRFDQRVVLRDEPFRTAMVFQEQAIFPWMSVIENVTLGLRAQGIPRAERDRQAQQILSQFGLTGFERYFPGQLSGGMRQRVALARAFLADPEILLMDEPFGSLDAQTKFLLQQELLKIWSQNRKTILFITHDIDEAITLGDRILVLSGRPSHIVESIPIPLERPRTEHILESPEMTHIKWHIWKILKDEVSKTLLT